VVAGRGGLSRGQEPDRLLAVKPKRLRVTRHRRATDMGDGGVGKSSLLDRVAVEASQGGQPPGHGGAAPAGSLEHYRIAHNRDYALYKQDGGEVAILT
jgi:hypothetical protein